MRDPNPVLTKLQVTIYLVEVAVLTGVFALAVATSPEFVLGPLARLAVAAALPAPCHLLFVTHVVLSRRMTRRALSRPVLVPHARPIPA